MFINILILIHLPKGPTLEGRGIKITSGILKYCLVTFADSR